MLVPLVSFLFWKFVICLSDICIANNFSKINQFSSVLLIKHLIFYVNYFCLCLVPCLSQGLPHWWNRHAIHICINFNCWFVCALWTCMLYKSRGLFLFLDAKLDYCVIIFEIRCPFPWASKLHICHIICSHVFSCAGILP